MPTTYQTNFVKISQQGSPHLPIREPRLLKEQRRKIQNESEAISRQLLTFDVPLIVVMERGKFDIYLGGGDLEVYQSLTKAATYFRLQVSESPAPDLGNASSVEVFRSLQAIGVGDPSRYGVRADDHPAPKYRRPLSPGAKLDLTQHSYRTIIPTAFSRPDCAMNWGHVYTALQDHPNAKVVLMVSNANLTPMELAHLERSVDLVAGSPWTRQYEGQLALKPCARMVTTGQGFSMRIAILGDDPFPILQAFFRDTDPQALAPSLRELSEEELALVHDEADRERLQKFVRKLSNLWSLEEVVNLIAGPRSFGDAIPGLEHYTPSTILRPQIRKPEKGKTFKLGMCGNFPVHYSFKDLLTGVFVTGVPGYGKTSTIRRILRKVLGRVPVLIIDPVGKEYSEFFRTYRREAEIVDFVSTFLRGNLFVAAPNVPIYHHIHIIVTMLSLLWPTTATARSYLQSVVIFVYLRFMSQALGRDLEPHELLIIKGKDQLAFPTMIPTFQDFLRLSEVWFAENMSAETHYNAESREYFRLRFSLLKNSIFAEIFRVEEDETLPPSQRRGVLRHESFHHYFERDCVVELGAIVNEEEGNAIFTLLVGLLYSHLVSDGLKDDLVHFCVMEELHRIAPKQVRSAGQDIISSAAQESDALVRKVTAEVRKYGGGLCLADQAPSQVTDAVLVNCSTQIIHRSFNGTDKETIRKTIGLSEFDESSLGYQQVGCATVFYPGADSPLPVKITSWKEEEQDEAN